VPQQHKIARLHAVPLRILSSFSWLGVDRQNAASACFVEVETDTGLKGHGITQQRHRQGARRHRRRQAVD
jgi:hypothetical protein